MPTIKKIKVTTASVVTGDTLAGYNFYSNIDGKLNTTVVTPSNATTGVNYTLSDAVHNITAKPVGTINGEFTAVTSAVVVVDLVLNTEYQAWLAEVNAKGYTEPTDPEKSALNAFMSGLSDSGLMARMKTGNIYGYGSFGAGTLNLKNPATYQHVAIGTPIFTLGKGVKSAGAGSGINTKYKVNEFSGIESDLTMVTFISGSGILANGIVYGSSTSTASANQRLSLQPRTAAVNDGSRFNYNIATTNFPSTNTRGLFIQVNKLNESIIYKDGKKAKSVTAITTTPPNLNNEVTLLGLNKGVNTMNFSSPFDKSVSCLFRFNFFNDTDVEVFSGLWMNFIKALNNNNSTFYVRPLGTTYGIGDGSSYENAWSGFANIGWESIKIFDTLYVCGIHTESLLAGAAYFNLRGDYSGDLAVIDGGNVRDSCLRINNNSFIKIYGFELKKATTDCLGIYGDAIGIEVNNTIAHTSGNQAFQNEQRVQVTYNNVKGYNCADDGISGHAECDIVVNNSEFYGNSQGVNAIGTSKMVFNNCNFHDNTENVRPDSSADFTLNDCLLTNGKIVPNSNIPLKLNRCTFNNAEIIAAAGIAIVTP